MRYLESFVKVTDLPNLYWQFNSCWYPGDARNQGISSHGIILFCQEWYGLPPQSLKFTRCRLLSKVIDHKFKQESASLFQECNLAFCKPLLIKRFIDLHCQGQPYIMYTYMTYVCTFYFQKLFSCISSKMLILTETLKYIMMITIISEKKKEKLKFPLYADT